MQPIHHSIFNASPVRSWLASSRSSPSFSMVRSRSQWCPMCCSHKIHPLPPRPPAHSNFSYCIIWESNGQACVWAQMIPIPILIIRNSYFWVVSPYKANKVNTFPNCMTLWGRSLKISVLSLLREFVFFSALFTQPQLTGDKYCCIHNKIFYTASCCKGKIQKYVNISLSHAGFHLCVSETSFQEERVRKSRVRVDGGLS